jgi:hypothetical protein
MQQGLDTTHLYIHISSHKIKWKPPEGRSHVTLHWFRLCLTSGYQLRLIIYLGRRPTENACHQLHDEHLKALFNLKCTYNIPGHGFHLNHASRDIRHAAKTLKNLPPKRLGKIH